MIYIFNEIPFSSIISIAMFGVVPREYHINISGSRLHVWDVQSDDVQMQWRLEDYLGVLWGSQNTPSKKKTDRWNVSWQNLSLQPNQSTEWWSCVFSFDLMGA